MAEWTKTNFPGVRYRKHASRKHGVQMDKYFTIRYKLHGKDKEEGMGWASEGWTESKAYDRLKELKENRKSGEGPQTLAEKRGLLDKQKEVELEAQVRQEQEAVTVTDYFDKTYFPWVKNNKAENTIRTERLLFNHWIKPVLGDIPLIEVVQTDIERVKQSMFTAKKAPKTVHHTLGLIRQIYNHAKRPDIYLQAKVKMPKVDNAKLRYLTPSEIDKLLTALREKSIIVHDQAVLAVNCGLRFSECSGLRWEDVNYDTGSMSIRDSKTGSRTVFLNDDVTEILKARQGEKKIGLAFPGDDDGNPQERASKTFQRVADDLFNKGVDDRRLRVTFHTLRHTFGTHVYENSGDLYLTQKALGHKTMIMAQRYAKMTETRLREAFTKMSDVMQKGREAVKKQVEEAEQGQQAGQVVNFTK
ncbi:MAG: tyrosine-type recombinase/integrase [Deltaproteobacteria bacterium]|nr:tyrosine-type recombinase/integrase [Deltaproteobacteria bacterium]